MVLRGSELLRLATQVASLKSFLCLGRPILAWWPCNLASDHLKLQSQLRLKLQLILSHLVECSFGSPILSREYENCGGNYEQSFSRSIGRVIEFDSDLREDSKREIKFNFKPWRREGHLGDEDDDGGLWVRPLLRPSPPSSSEINQLGEPFATAPICTQTD